MYAIATIMFGPVLMNVKRARLFFVEKSESYNFSDSKELRYMKALFLAGGIGTRLKPLTNELPKPMVPIMNKPLLQRSMENLRKFGINEIVISTGYKTEHIENYFGNGKKFGLNIEYICEETPMGTGGAIKKTEHLYNDTFLILNADILCNIDFLELVKFHQDMKASVTIAVTSVGNPSAYGVVEYDDFGYAVSFTEKPDAHLIKSNYINAGVYVFEPEVLKEILEGIPVSVERETFPKLLKNGNKVAVYKGCKYWMDIGTPEKYMQTHDDIMSGECQLSDMRFSSDRIFIEDTSQIDLTATIRGPVYIGNNVKIGANARIGPNAVLGDDVCINAGGRVINSILWENVTLNGTAEMNGLIAATSFSVKCKAIISDAVSAYNENLLSNYKMLSKKLIFNEQLLKLNAYENKIGVNNYEFK
jgi:mannose-1-phosphate guanylyltransferase